MRFDSLIIKIGAAPAYLLSFFIVMTVLFHLVFVWWGNNIYLKYYAGEDGRSLWVNDFPGEPIPGRERLPFDRDRHLPKPSPEENFGVH